MREGKLLVPNKDIGYINEMIDLLLIVTENPGTIGIPSYVNLYKYTIEGRYKGWTFLGRL